MRSGGILPSAAAAPSRSAAVLAALALALAATVAPAARADSPSLGSILPRGGQRGKEVVFTFGGERLADAAEVLFYSPGFNTTKLEPAGEKQVKATVAIASDCRLGEHAVRLRTATGISDLRTIFVGALPEVDEKEPNGDFQAPQAVPLEVTIAGVVAGEDVDVYSFKAKKGQRVTAEIEGMRLASTHFDPHVSILNPARFELAAADDSPLLGQDAVASVVIPADGVYRVQVRETSYGGSDSCRYRLHLGTFPRPLAALPSGGKPGEEVEVLFLGDAAGEFRQKFKLPAEIVPDFGLFAQDAAGIAPSAVPFRLSPLDNVIEAEPNDSHDSATRGAVPGAFNGVIGKPRDTDFFRFPAKKGQSFDVHLYARRLRSPLDPVMVVHHAGGGGIAGNDDAVGPDSYFRFTAPEDKEYVVSVSDHLQKGGPYHAYRIEFAPVAPQLSVSIPQATQYSQERQGIAVPRGNRAAALLRTSRSDFGGPLEVEAAGLPAGVTLLAGPVAANTDALPVVFEAAADAPLGGALVRLGARHADSAQKVSGGFYQMAEMVLGPPNNALYWKVEVDRAAVVVAEPAPFRIRIVEPKVPIVQNGVMALKVVAERNEGFKAPIGIQMVYNPPGINSAGGVAIPEGQNEAVIAMNSSGDAPVGEWKIAVAGSATARNGPVWVSTPPAVLRVAPPYLTFQMDRASVEQGKETDVFVKVEHRVPVDAPAKARLIGLPARTAAAEVDVTKETKEFSFKVKTEPQSPAGQHKNLFCQVIVTENGEPITHSLGSSELRIDVPLPPKPNAPPPAAEPAKAAAPAPAAPPAPKRLSPLEKLRLEKQEKDRAKQN